MGLDSAKESNAPIEIVQQWGLVEVEPKENVEEDLGQRSLATVLQYLTATIAVLE